MEKVTKYAFEYGFFFVFKFLDKPWVHIFHYVHPVTHYALNTVKECSTEKDSS